MNSAFASWSDFFAMGGYGFYVWLAVSFTIFPLLALCFHSWAQHRAILRGLQKQQEREARMRAAKMQKELA